MIQVVGVDLIWLAPAWARGARTLARAGALISFGVARRGTASHLTKGTSDGFEPRRRFQASSSIATPVVVALISAVSALVVALANIAWQYVQAQRGRREQEERDRQAQKDREALEQLREEVDTRKAQRDARLDYEYEARMELYKSSEPLLFQLHELAQIAWFRTLSLARTASLGHLDARESWLGGAGYYMLSTIYALFAPLAVFRLLQRRLTFLDIGLDESVGQRYRIARALYSMLAEHHDLARIEPALPYDPHGPEADARRKRSPARYWI